MLKKIGGGFCARFLLDNTLGFLIKYEMIIMVNECNMETNWFRYTNYAAKRRNK